MKGKYIRTSKHIEESRQRATGNTFNKGKHISETTRTKMISSALKRDSSYLLGQKRTVVTKENISNALKGKYVGNKNPFYGKHHTEETKKKIRDSRDYLQITGENSPNWKGGCLSTINKQALKRDNYTCQKCGLKDEEIVVVDHIKPKAIYPELKNDINNLQTLCPNCHVRKTVNELKEIIKIKNSKI